MSEISVTLIQKTVGLTFNQSTRVIEINVMSNQGGGQGNDGKSAYEVAVQNGFSGTESQWLTSLIGADGDDGKSAYEVAVQNGFSGTESQWLTSLIGDDGKSAYEVAVQNGFSGTESQWLNSLVGPSGKDSSTVLFKSITQTIITGKTAETSIYSIPLPTDGFNYAISIYSQAQISTFAGAAISHRLRIGTYSSPIDGASGANAIGNQTLIAINSASSGVQMPITRKLIFRGGTSGSIYGIYTNVPVADDGISTNTFTTLASKDFTTQHYLYVTFNPSVIVAVVQHNQILVTLIKI